MLKLRKKSDVKRWDLSRTSGQLFHIVLEDNTGTIRATIFDEAVEKLFYVFEVGKEYAISNGKVRRKPDYSFEMTIGSYSIVTPLSKKNPPIHSTSIPSPTLDPPVPKIRSILKVPSVSDEEDIGISPSRNRNSDTIPRSILKNSGDEDNTFLRDHNHLSDDSDQPHYRRYVRNHEVEEAEEEDHGMKTIKRVGFKETGTEPSPGKKVVFKEIEIDSKPNKYQYYNSYTRNNHSEETEDEEYVSTKKVGFKEMESDSSTDRQSSPITRKKKSVSFQPTSEDIHNLISSPKSNPQTSSPSKNRTNDHNFDEVLSDNAQTTGLDTSEKISPYNLRKFFG